MKKSELERLAKWQLLALGAGRWHTQHAFDPENRRRKADFALLPHRIIVEIDGGTWARKGSRRCKVCGQTPAGGHSTGKGYERDRERDARALILGWTVLRFTGAMVLDGRMVQIMTKLCETRGIVLNS